ncbi:MAG: energy transducer TonB [Gemmatimonadota bacterium]
MFDNLIESAPKKQKNFGQTAASLLFHGALIFVAVKATSGAAETLKAVLQDTTVVFLEPPKPVVQQPPPEQQVVVAMTPPPQGFQTITPPTDIPKDIPPIDLNQRFDPKDFTGKGVEGGIATGVVGGTGPVPVVTGEVFLAAEVEEPPSAAAPISPRYPEVMKQAGITGKVVMQFVVNVDGHVEPTSFKIISSTNKAFEEPAREAILKALFKPGKSRGQPVRVLVQQSMSFNLS